MLINGEKWACEACVRGHRVSNCQHYDRPLQHINKKGRPVTQCQHCRSQRKNRSAHVKCDCGEKTTKCIHLGAIEGHRESCCCNHGGRCTCALKKDLDPVPETSGVDSGSSSGETAATGTPSTTTPTPTSVNGSVATKAPVRRRRANTTRSESTLSLEDHTRYKCLSQKHTRVTSQKNRPFPPNRLHSARSSGSLPGFLQAVKTEVEDDDQEDDDHSSGNGSSESGADDDVTSALAMPFGDSVSTAASSSTFCPSQHSQKRRSRSETASPQPFANSLPQTHQLNDNSQLSPLEVNFAGYTTTAYTNYCAFSPEQLDQPLFSAGLSAPSIDWAQLGLSLDRSLGSGNESDKLDSAARTLGFGGNVGYDFNGSEQAPTMTTATSGEVSEAEDMMAPGLDDYEYDFDRTNDGTNSSVAFSRANSGFQIGSTAAILNELNVSSDFNEHRYLKNGNKFLPTPQIAANEEFAVLASATGLSQAQAIEDDAPLWMTEYSSGLPTMTESPGSDGISFWAPK